MTVRAALGLLLLATPAVAQTSAEAILRAVDSEAGIQVSARVETLDGVKIVDYDGATPRVLASNTKLLTSAAALLGMDPERRWTTRCVIRDGVLWIVGDGDPSLRETAEADGKARFLDALVAALSEAEVGAVSEIVLDARAFGGEHRPPGWPENQWEADYCAPSAALQVAGSRLRVALRDGRPRITPALGGHLRVEHRGEGGRPFAVWWGTPDLRLFVQGQRSGPEPAEIAVRDPLWLYGAWLHEGLERRGVEVGAVRSADAEEIAPDDEPLLEHASLWTLAEALVVVNKDSDNQIAETVLRTLGLAHSGAGTREAGLAAVRELLGGVGVPLEGLVQVDGSGMSRSADPEASNRASPEQLCALLRGIAEEETGRVLFQSLPIGGAEGRLESRFRDAVFRPGRVRAKTGFITGASSLSGYLLAADDTMLVFSIVVNYTADRTARTNNRRFKRMQEDFLAAILEDRPWN